MRRVACLLLLLGCSDRISTGDVMAQGVELANQELQDRLVPDAAPPPPPQVVSIPMPEVRPRAKLELSLRSTPSGAMATLDGRPVGTTPVRLEISDDGKPHLFAFVLAGHRPWNLRFVPIKDGVIHATLEAYPSRMIDAGAD